MEIGFALLPDKEFIEQLVNIEHRQHNTLGFTDYLGFETNVPHMTLFQGNLVNNLNCEDVVNKIVSLIRTMDYKQVEMGSPEYFPKGWYFYLAKKSPQLINIHLETLELCKKNIILDPMRITKEPCATANQYDKLQKYGFKYAEEEFIPHIVIGRTPVKLFEYENDITNELRRQLAIGSLKDALKDIRNPFDIESVICYQLGSNGVCERIIFKEDV